MMLLFHFVLTLYILVLLTAFWDFWTIECVRLLGFWMFIYLLDELVHIVLYSVAVYSWCRANDPPLIETRISVFGSFWLYLFGFAWVIYGSTFVFSEEIDNCDLESEFSFQGFSETVSIRDVRITVKVLIVLGYVMMLIALCITCASCALYALYRNWTAQDL